MDSHSRNYGVARELRSLRKTLTDSSTQMLLNDTGGPIEFTTLYLQNTNAATIDVSIFLVKLGDGETNDAAVGKIIHKDTMDGVSRQNVLLDVLDPGDAIYAIAATASVINLVGGYLEHV